MPKLLLIADYHPGSLGLYYERAFVSLDWTVVRYDYGAAYSLAWPFLGARALRRALRPLIWQRMNAEVIDIVSGTCDMVLAVKAPFLDIPTVRSLRDRCPATVMIYPDSPWDEWTQRRDVLSVLAAFARTYIWSHSLVNQLRDNGICASYLAFAWDNEYGVTRGDNVERAASIAFAAQPYPNRIEWLKALEGLPVVVYGPQWAQSWFGAKSSVRVIRTAMMGADIARVYASIQVAINITNPKNFSGHNMRMFEIPATGALMITNHTTDLEEYFPPWVACLSAATPEEFRSQCQWALANPLKAAEIAAEGTRYAKGHTYKARARQILNDLEQHTNSKTPRVHFP